MGYWDQVGEENRKHRDKPAAIHPLRRKVSDALGTRFMVAASLALGAVMLVPVLLWLLFVWL